MLILDPCLLHDTKSSFFSRRYSVSFESTTSFFFVDTSTGTPLSFNNHLAPHVVGTCGEPYHLYIPYDLRKNHGLGF